MIQATLRTILAISLLSLWCSNVPAADKPLKVYFLVGQSNMVGNGAVDTFDYMGDDPETAPMLKQMRDADGKPYVCERVWVSSFTGKMNQESHAYVGRLCVGLGKRKDHAQLGERIGPEYPFGIVMEQAYDGQILIIKTAWGGQSLCRHFRSPGADPYEFTDYQKKMFALVKKTESQQRNALLERIEKLETERAQELEQRKAQDQTARYERDVQTAIGYLAQNAEKHKLCRRLDMAEVAAEAVKEQYKRLQSDPDNPLDIGVAFAQVEKQLEDFLGKLTSKEDEEESAESAPEQSESGKQEKPKPKQKPRTLTNKQSSEIATGAADELTDEELEEVALRQLREVTGWG